MDGHGIRSRSFVSNRENPIHLIPWVGYDCLSMLPSSGIRADQGDLLTGGQSL